MTTLSNDNQYTVEWYMCLLNNTHQSQVQHDSRLSYVEKAELVRMWTIFFFYQWYILIVVEKVLIINEKYLDKYKNKQKCKPNLRWEFASVYN